MFTEPYNLVNFSANLMFFVSGNGYIEGDEIDSFFSDLLDTGMRGKVRKILCDAYS